MKRKIIFFIILLIPFILFSKEFSDYKIEYKKFLINNLDMLKYINGSVTGVGPYFLNNKEILFCLGSEEKKEKIIILNIETNKTKDFRLKKDIDYGFYGLYINKVGFNIYLYDYKDIFLLENNMLIDKQSGKGINIFNDFWITSKGIINKSNNKVIDDFIDRAGINAPILDKDDKDNFYWLTKSEKYNESFKLKRYNIKENKVEIIYDGVFCFTIIPENPEYLLIFAEGSKYHAASMGYFNGDFIIIKNNGEVIKNFDKEHYDSNVEFFIYNFDINENNEIAAIGYYTDYLINTRDPNNQRVKEGLFLLKLIEGNEKNISTGKNIYYTPTVNNLRFRASPDLKGKFIRSLVKGEKLELLERAKTETIQGTKGTCDIN